MTFTAFPKVQAAIIGDVPRILDARGNDVTLTLEGCERIAEMWNALRHVAFPANHLNATEEYVERLEALRKAAVADLEAARATRQGEAA